MMISPRAVPGLASGRAQVIEDRRSFEDFFEQTHQRLFGGLCLITGNRHEAEEVMQDAYLKVWERWTGSARWTSRSGSCSGRP